MGIVVDKKLLNKPPEKHWISLIKQRIRQNKNFIALISGATGSGKSYASLRIGEELDPDFNIDRVVFNGRELMALINSGTLKKGSVIVFEEAGIEINSRNWQSTTNKMLNFLMQTFRHRNIVLIFNTPFLDFVDGATRKLFHAEISTMSIDRKKNEVRLKPRQLQYNPYKKKFYYHRLKVILERGAVPIDTWSVGLPSKELIKAYEDKKTEFTDELNKSIVEGLDAIHNKGKKKTNPLTDVQQGVLDLLKQGMTPPQIAKERDRSETAIKSTILALKNKGYKIYPRYEPGSLKKVIDYTVIEPGGSN